MPNSIKEYLEKGRAGKVFDVNKNLWIDPTTGKAFIPSFTNIQGNENMPVRPYSGGTFPSGPGGQDQVQYAGGDPNVPVEQRPAHMVGKEEGVYMGPGGPRKAMQVPSAPNPDNPPEMAKHVVDQMLKNGEFDQILGIKPGQKLTPQLAQAKRQLATNTFKQMTDHFAIRDRAQKSYRQDTMKKSGMNVDKIYQRVDELVNPPVDPVTNRPKRPPMSEEEALKYVFGTLNKINQYLGEQPGSKAGGPQKTQRPTGGPQTPPGNQGRGRVIGKLKVKSTGETVNVYEDGTALIGGQMRQVPENILKSFGVQAPKKAAPRPKGEISKMPASKIPGRSGSELDAMLETGMPEIGYDYQRHIPRAYNDMYKQYLKQ